MDRIQIRAHLSISSFEEGGKILRYNKKVICIGIIKAVAFVLVFLLLFQSAINLFRSKDTHYPVSSVYDLPKNSVDVLLLGSSHMFASISPMDLWNDYGITSFNASLGNLSIPSAYFELRELLKVQKPKMLVLETYFIYFSEMVVKNDWARYHYIVDNLRFSSGLHEAIQTLFPEDRDKTEYYLNFFNYHNRWKTLSETDFNPYLLKDNIHNRGADAVCYYGHRYIETPSIIPRSETEMPPELPLEYLYKIIELCKEKDISLVFMAQPCDIGSDIQKMINYVDIISEEEDIPYINFFYLLDETGFDFAKDMANAGHINYFGAQKLTAYLGEYLQTNYQLEDHRGDPDVADLWNKDYETFSKEINNLMMTTAENTEEYFRYLRNQDYILAWNAYSETPLSETALPEYLAGIGIDPAGVKEKNQYYAVTRGDQTLHGGATDTRPDDSYMADDMLFSFGDGIVESTNRIGIHAGRTEYSVGNNGLNLVVYDPMTRTVVNSVNIDLSTGDIKMK